MHGDLSLVGQQSPARIGVSWLAKGFRPFFFGAATHAVLSIPAWIAVLSGVPRITPTLTLGWHAHEMVFGFAGAVIAGFLLTAVSNWTNRPTLEGAWLAALFATWLGARLVPWLPGVSGVVALVLDVAFWAGLALACARPILAVRSTRNLGFIALLLGFLVACTISHASRLGFPLAAVGPGHLLGLDLVVVAILVMTGRVVPMFTRNATRVASIAGQPALDRAAVAGMVLLTLLDLAQGPAWIQAVVAALVGALALLRARRWGAQHTRGNALLWPLHLGNAWIGLGLILRAVSALVPAVPPSVALHAITVGGIGLLCFSMMTRVTLGHTGRMLAVPRLMVWAAHALSLAVVVRVLGPLLAPSVLLVTLALSALLWSLAFASYLFVYAPALLSPRVDGKAG
ncbi:MAG TPA: NnrS family protein [Polyangiaceae bacterium]